MKIRLSKSPGGIGSLVLCLFPLIFLSCSNRTGFIVEAESKAETVVAPFLAGRDATRWPVVPSPLKSNPKLEEQVSHILAGMTLAQKVAQMIQPEIKDITVEDMRRYGFGSYLNGGGTFPNNEKQSSVGDWVDLAEALYQASVDASLDGSTIPTMWGTDAVHGHNNVIGATIFPHNIGLGAARDTELLRKIAGATAREVMATGIDWVFAPTVAVVRDDRWGRTYEGYSEDPEITRSYASAIVEGLQGRVSEDFLSNQRVISTVKHFVGDGGTEKGDDQGNNKAAEQEIIDIHAQGYFSGLAAGAQSVMASFNSWKGEKLHGHHYLLTTVLKERMGFDGFVVGDWNGHGQVKGCRNDSCPQAVNAGIDILMAPTPTWKPLYENTIKQVESGEISLERIDDAVTRILRVKLRAGLFDKPSPKSRVLAGRPEIIGHTEHRKVAREAVRKSLVLLKNNHSLLPLAPKQNVFVTGDAAHNIGKQSGGWTITWQGTNNKNSDFPQGVSIYDGIQSVVEAAGGSVELGQDAEFKATPDVAIVVFGEEPYAEGSGDIDNLEYQRSNKTDLLVLKQLKEKGIPVVSIFISGRAMWVNPELNASDAFVAAWLPGTEGAGVADVLFKGVDGKVEYDFTGKLSYSWPRFADQTSVNRHDESYNPLFPYGYGLNYRDDQFVANDLSEVSTTSQKDALALQTVFSQGVKIPWRVTVQQGEEEKNLVSNVYSGNYLNLRATDRTVQEDSILVEWLGGEETALKFTSNFLEDLRAYVEHDAVLSFDLAALEKPNQAVVLAMDCGDQCKASIGMNDLIGQVALGVWQTISIDLACFVKQGAKMHQISSVFSLETEGKFKAKISEVFLLPMQKQSATVKCPD